MKYNVILVLVLILVVFTNCSSGGGLFGLISKPYEENVDKAKLAEILYKAKIYFKRGDIATTWDLVNQAEELAPEDYRVSAMKGSLLYQAGGFVEAKEYWNKSLKKNPIQPDIKAMLRKMQSEGN